MHQYGQQTLLHAPRIAQLAAEVMPHSPRSRQLSDQSAALAPPSTDDLTHSPRVAANYRHVKLFSKNINGFGSQVGPRRTRPGGQPPAVPMDPLRYAPRPRMHWA